MPRTKSALALLLSVVLTMPALDGCNKREEKKQESPVGQPPAPQATYARPSADQLYQMVAPIALFPDNLVAQVLAGSTYPDQIASAATWLKQNANLKGNDLMQAVNQQPWDVSVKGLTQFPDVLNQMASNLSWTSALGDAYFNIPQDVMNSVQVMRQRASQAGNLKSSPQQTVTTESASAPPPQSSSDQQPTVVEAPPQTIVIQPAQPDVIYVPSYNPTVVYGASVAAYPGYVAPPSTGEVVAAGLISFGVGMAVGAAMSNSCCGWGWNSWGCGWHNSTVVYNHNTYVSNSNTFVNRNNYYNRNVNNVNRNNLNANNFNRNNINSNYRNNDYRANNFNNTARNSNFTTPNFGTQHNQSQFRNANESVGQRGDAGNRMNSAAQNRQSIQQAADRQPIGQTANRQQLGQASDRQLGQASNRTQMAQNEGHPNFNQAQRGFGQQERSTNSGAFSNYGQGGNARVNSARGQESLSGNRGSSARAGGGSGGRR
ncbi:MAG TPA: DUF3300 domain-containing protein [Terriglobales bacterium]|nr:DUF3300 domain-containing protein [Terriglobales bacterium]